jgi:hypothetical protein
LHGPGAYGWANKSLGVEECTTISKGGGLYLGEAHALSDEGQLGLFGSGNCLLRGKGEEESIARIMHNVADLQPSRPTIFDLNR